LKKATFAERKKVHQIRQERERKVRKKKKKNRKEPRCDRRENRGPRFCAEPGFADPRGRAVEQRKRKKSYKGLEHMQRRVITASGRSGSGVSINYTRKRKGPFKNCPGNEQKREGNAWGPRHLPSIGCLSTARAQLSWGRENRKANGNLLPKQGSTAGRQQRSVE